MSEFSENKQLNREHSFYNSIVVLVHLLFVVVAFITFVYGIKSYDDHDGWTLYCLVKFGLAAGLFAYYYYSVHNGSGLFYALDLWEQSLLRRRSDDELIHAYHRGEKIFKDFREAEVFDGRIVPKADGIRLRPPDTSTEDNEEIDA
jgi:hypothetical protein